MAILNNLYPPIVDTYMPAFVLGDSCRVYFSLSQYNSSEDIAYTQITVRSQDTNRSVLKKDKYPSEVKLTAGLGYDGSRSDRDDPYYIEIQNGDLEEGFQVNQYYKVQIRFVAKGCSQAPNDQSLNSWMSENLDYTSEWSTVCLVRGITRPNVIIKGLDYIGTTSEKPIIWSSSNVNFEGYLDFGPYDNETLKSYRIQFYDVKDNLLTDSNEIFTSEYNNINQFNYILKYLLQDGEQYKIRFHYTTRNLYEETIDIHLFIILGGADPLDVTLSSTKDIENGRIGIKIRSNTLENFTGNITIRRASSETGFKIWEDIYTFSLADTVLDITWYDKTIKSGVWYRYCVQQRDSLGNRGVVTNLKYPVMIVFEDMFLTREDKQLKIRFDPDISSFKYTVYESKTDTIGGKFPIIKRNGHTYYREFPISGTITHFMDNNKLFTSREKIYESEDNELLDLYDNYNKDEKITPFNDYTYERDFRDAVMEFLYDNNVKLFRSVTEGNILVKLTNISFTPNKTLGRMLYSFSCTATEIDENTIENYDYYGIQGGGKINEQLAFQDIIIGQYNGKLAASDDLLEALQAKYENRAKDNYILKVDYLNYLRIEMQSPPYLIREEDGVPKKVVDTNSRMANKDFAYLGYVIEINGNSTVINKEGIYELSQENLKITSVKFPNEEDVDLNFNVHINQYEDVSRLSVSTNYYSNIGQLTGKFGYQQSIYRTIKNKYLQSYYERIGDRIVKYSTALLSIEGINIEVDPNTVIYVQESRESGFNRHVVGQTGALELYDNEALIEDFYFSGIHFEEATDYEADRLTLPDCRFIDTGIQLNSLNNIKIPLIRNGVYTLKKNKSLYKMMKQSKNEAYTEMLLEADNNEKYKEVLENETSNKYIWYNHQWWIFTESHDLLCPVEALIDYNYESVRGMYETK